MNPARVFKVKNRLAQIVRVPGGKTVAEAVRKADSRIETLRESTVASFQDQVARLSQQAEVGRAQPDTALKALYRTANDIFSLAGVFGYHGLGEAAYGLCDLAQRYGEEGPVNWPAIDVHIDGIRLLASPDCDNVEVVLQGLRDVRARVLSGA